MEETSLRGDGGILLLVLLLLYGSAGCIIAPDGDMFHGSPSGCGEDVVYLCGDDSEKRKETEDVQISLELQNFDVDGNIYI